MISFNPTRTFYARFWEWVGIKIQIKNIGSVPKAAQSLGGYRDIPHRPTGRNAFQKRPSLTMERAGSGGSARAGVFILSEGILESLVKEETL